MPVGTKLGRNVHLDGSIHSSCYFVDRKYTKEIKRPKSDKKVVPLPKEYKTISLEYWPFSKDQNTIPYIEPMVNFSECKIPYDTDGMLKTQI